MIAPDQMRGFEQRVAPHFYFENGVWRDNCSIQLLYPEGGNQTCYEIEDQSFWFAHRNRCIQAAVQKYGAGNCFLDVGGGNGYVTKALQDDGFFTVLIEPGIQGCQNARSRGVASIICAGMENLDFTNEKVTSVGLFDVLEHIEDEDSFLNSVKGALIFKGKLFLTVPAHLWLWSHEDVAEGHCRRYSMETLRAVLERNGFKVLYRTYFFECLLLPILLMRRIPYLFGKKHQGYSGIKHEHKTFPKGLMRFFLDSEFKRVLSGRIHLGTSILVVAEKQC